MRKRRIELPSGKIIEFFSKEPEPMHPTRDPLHKCQQPGCGSNLVYPTTWEEYDDEHWSISLRCPDCEWVEDGVYPQAMCNLFDDALEEGHDALTRDYKRLMTANLADEIGRFVGALTADAILPMDF